MYSTHGNAIALSCQCKCITIRRFHSVPHLGWRLATIARIENHDRDGMLDRANVQEIGRLFEIWDYKLADGLGVKSGRGFGSVFRHQ